MWLMKKWLILYIVQVDLLQTHGKIDNNALKDRAKVMVTLTCQM